MLFSITTPIDSGIRNLKSNVIVMIESIFVSFPQYAFGQFQVATFAPVTLNVIGQSLVCQGVSYLSSYTLYISCYKFARNFDFLIETSKEQALFIFVIRSTLRYNEFVGCHFENDFHSFKIIDLLSMQPDSTI